MCWGSVNGSLDGKQSADLNRTIFSLVDVIASLTSAIIAGGTLTLGITAGFRGEARDGSAVRDRRGDDRTFPTDLLVMLQRPGGTGHSLDPDPFGI